MSSEQNTTSIFRDRYFIIGMAIYTGYPENKKKRFSINRGMAIYKGDIENKKYILGASQCSNPRPLVQQPPTTALHNQL